MALASGCRMSKALDYEKRIITEDAWKDPGTVIWAATGRLSGRWADDEAAEVDETEEVSEREVLLSLPL